MRFRNKKNQPRITRNNFLIIIGVISCNSWQEIKPMSLTSNNQFNVRKGF